MSSTNAPRSKTLATWLAFVGGGLGLHRFYLRGTHDTWGWLHWPPTLLGAWGVSRMLELGQDDRLAWALIPLLGLSVSAGMLAAIVHGLTPDDAWDAAYNAAAGRSRPGGWLNIFGVLGALSVGATVLIATIAFSGQRYFESQIESAPAFRP
jgi:hypothetical protein